MKFKPLAEWTREPRHRQQCDSSQPVPEGRHHRGKHVNGTIKAQGDKGPIDIATTNGNIEASVGQLTDTAEVLDRRTAQLT